MQGVAATRKEGDMIDVLKKHLEAFTKDDWDQFRALLADDARFEEVPTRQTASRLDDIVAIARRWKRAFPDARFTIKNSVAAADKVVIELEWQGTHRGPLEGPFGTIPPTGRTGRVAAVQIGTVRNGKLVELRHYFDLMTVLAQLGVGTRPEAQAPAPTTP
jgi:steroid delta-isomerase-like uncharacterized protein